MNKEQNNELYPFDKEIIIHVEVSAIYKKLLETFPADYKHKEILAHAIIGTTMDDSRIGYIYNALNGYPNSIDFKVGDVVVCDTLGRRQLKQPEDVVSVNTKPQLRTETVKVGRAKVVEIDMYSNTKLKIEFEQNKYNSEEMETTTIWVNHKECTKWQNH